MAVAGIFLTNSALGPYPPLGRDTLVLSHDLDFIALASAIAVLLFLLGRLARHISFVRAMFVLASATTLLLAAFFFLNGALDKHRPVEADALLSTKYVTQGKFTGPFLVLSIAWNHRRIEETLRVSREIFSAVEPGDSVRVVVHPGAFSTPWYGGVLPSGSRASNSK
jgi:hypothetical protein